MDRADNPPRREMTLTTRQALDLARQYYNAGQLPEAEDIYQQILKIEPNQPDALHLLGVIASRTGRNDIAVEMIIKALAARPDNAGAHNNLGIALRKLGKLEEAAASYREALTINPDAARTHSNLGHVLQDLGRLDGAAASYGKALAINPDDAEAHNDLGNVLQNLDRPAEAVASYHKALAVNPDYAEAHNNLGSALQSLGTLDEAVASYYRALAIKPDYAVAHYNLGNALRESGMPDEAAASYDKALALNSEHVDAHNNLGLALQDLGKLDEAAAGFHKALAINPDDADARFNLGILQLLMGDFQNGWQNYDSRWRRKDSSFRPRDYLEPLWDGHALDGKTIFIYWEQGLGDAIQFARTMPLLAARGGRVVFQVQEALLRLFQGSGLAENLIGPDESPPPFDCHASLLDLPRLLNTSLETIPGGPPYLKAPPQHEEEWAERLRPDKRLRLGIAWAGSLGHKNDRNRSVEASLFQPLTEIPGVSVYSLQVGGGDEAEQVFGNTVTDLAPSLTDFADTAAAISNLDLIVSVDTAVAHLAGALGRPVWTLLPFMPDWRWLLDRDDSPWYPTMRLFRQQKRGDWQGVFERVVQALRDQIGGTRV